MKLGTMASDFIRHTDSGRDYINAMYKVIEAGFDVMDPNMGSLHSKKCEFNRDEWESIAHNLRNEAEKKSFSFPQVHLPFSLPITRRKNANDPGAELNEHFIIMSERAIKIASILGVKWGVVHPVQASGAMEFDFYEDVAYNREVYGRYVELAEKLGVGIAFENLADVDEKRRFGTMPAELIAIVESFGSDNIGICWDFGHGNRTYRGSQASAIRKIGKYLRATHVDDNVGKEDLHTLPYLGNAKWEDIMSAVGEIGYDGSFVFETRCTKSMPEALKMNAAKFKCEVGRYLISLAQKRD